MATKTELLKKIRMFCAECMGGPRASKDVWPISNISDVADCLAEGCVWHKYRFGRDPDREANRADHLREYRFKPANMAE